MLRAAETIWKTDTGRQRRDNEDNAFARTPVFVVADGMGGAQAGEVASGMAIEVFEQGLPDAGTPQERLADRVREANRRIYERAQAERGRQGMGTTLTAAYVDDSELAIAHVGDSRAYMFRDGTLQRLTRDHSLVEELVLRGKLTEEQAAEHPQRSIITRALGPEPEVEVDTWTYPLHAGDIVLLCSDGLTSMIAEKRVREILSSTSTLEHAADELIGAANEAGGRDNITVVLFRLEESEGDEAADQPTMVGASSPAARDEADTGSGERPQEPQARPGAVAVAPRPPLEQHATRPRARRIPPMTQPMQPARARRRRRFARPVAALVALAVVLFLVLGGGYLASRQLYFVGTNSQGVVTIYRGLPYDLPAGIHLYETFYISGVPATLVPADRRHDIFDNRLRSQPDAESLVRTLERGQLQ